MASAVGAHATTAAVVDMIVAHQGSAFCHSQARNHLPLDSQHSVTGNRDQSDPSHPDTLSNNEWGESTTHSLFGLGNHPGPVAQIVTGMVAPEMIESFHTITFNASRLVMIITVTVTTVKRSTVARDA